MVNSSKELTTLDIPEPFFHPTQQEINFQNNIAKIRANNPDEIILAPQVGPQTRFCLMGTHKNPCDMIFLLGAAGSAKTFSGLLKFAELVSKKTNDDAIGVMFRKTSSDIRKGGSLLDSSRKVFGHLKGVWNDTKMRWTFPNGATVNLSHLQHEKDIESHLSAQYAAIFFDEIVQFSKEQVFGLFARLRSMSGIRPFLVGATNPDTQCEWMKELIMPHFVDDEGWVKWENSGRVMYFYNDSQDQYHKWWSEEEAQEWWKNEYPHEYQKVLDGKRKMSKPTSLTCIPSLLEHNPALEEIDPNYRQKMDNLPLKQRMIMTHGNWVYTDNTSDYFNQDKIIELPDIGHLPQNLTLVRGYDLAYSRESVGLNSATKTKKKPDYTASVLMAKDKKGSGYYVLDARRIRGNLDDVKQFMRDTAKEDAEKYHKWGGARISIPQDPGSGKGVSQSIIKFLDGYTVKTSPEFGTKLERFLPFCTQVSNDQVKCIKGEWVKLWKAELTQFPRSSFDDLVDASSRSFAELALKGSYNFGAIG